MTSKVRYVDLSVPMANIDYAVEGYSPEEIKVMSPNITYQSHKDTLPACGRVFHCKEDDIPEGLGWAAEMVTLGTHAGTHLDAPYHFRPTSEGKPAKTIDQMPLELCFGKGVVFDMRHKQSGEHITAADLQRACEKMGYMIGAGEMALIMTGADKRMRESSYWNEYPGMSRESTLWLIDRGVKVMGTDALGWDVPFHCAGDEFKATGDNNVIWEAHRAGAEREYYHLEKMGNLDRLPPHGFDLICIPISVVGASAGWCRPVAIIKEG